MKRTLILSIGLLAACAHLESAKPSIVWVEGEGLSATVGTDLAETKRRALAAALRDAVEKAVGVRLVARTRISQSLSTEQQIEASSEGIIRSYELVSESLEQGFHKTRIRAQVEIARQPRHDVPSSSLGRGTPVSLHLQGPKAGTTETILRRCLIENGFTIVDKSHGEVVAVEGRVASYAIGMVGTWSSLRAQLTVEARLVKTGRVLWIQKQEASAAAPSSSAADVIAHERVGLAIASELAREVASRLEG